MSDLKQTIDEALNNHRSKYFFPAEITLTTTAFVSIVGIILETVPSLESYFPFINVIELLAAVIFTIEYASRIWTSKKKTQYIFSFWGITDLLAILPTLLIFINLSFLKSARTIRMLRLVRMIRVLKITREYLETHDQAKSQVEFNKINIVIYFLALFSSITIFGSALYLADETQPAYSTIPFGMLEAAKILLGGLGQANPATMTGQIIMLITRFAGLALFGLLITVIGGILNEFLFGKQHK
ncbi:ion transporter [Candidatus Curtissbacteria bacterium]|nr:ion transporter [Candidatus Curtissbacteria bacterium]